MAARAIWKGIITFADITLPVKLYSAVEDRTVHFRLLHRDDGSPVKQAMVNPDTGDIVPPDQTLRAWHTEEGEEVLLTQEELTQLKPEKSRQIAILKFLPQQVIDHRWYDRPYYLGPDGADAEYAALIKALATSQHEGLAHWVMRNKEYFGALRLFQGYPMLISLRYAEQVVAADELQPPSGKPLDERELNMARQLINMLDAEFEPEVYHDEYRERVLELIAAKQRGEHIKRPPPRQKQATDDITQALEASLKGLRHG